MCKNDILSKLICLLGIHSSIMLKKLIEPLQLVLLQRKQCPGCTRSLDHQYTRIVRMNQTEQVNCECGRIYIYDKQVDSYRRALASEVK